MAILPLQLSRVSNLMRSNAASQTISRTQAQLLKVQNELSTGRRLILPSDSPGDAAIAQQLRKLLEQRQAYATNLNQARNHLTEVDSALGELSELLRQAQTLASANVGSDVTPDQRENAATVADALYRQILSLANRQIDGAYLFAGDRATEAPFVEVNGGVKFVGSTTLLGNLVDERTNLIFQADGATIFHALANRVQGSVDLNPAVTATTRIEDLNGAAGRGVQLGTIVIGNGIESASVDLSTADTLGDIVARINAANVGGITASLSSSGLVLTGGAGDDITVIDSGGSRTAADLGILRPVGAGGGVPLIGQDLDARLTLLTPLSALNGGSGIDLTSGIILNNGLSSATINFAGATTVQDLLNRINDSGTAVRAQINAAGTGIDILNPTQGMRMTIAENGGTTARDLGIRSFDTTTPLKELNLGRGVRTVDGTDVRITDSAGISFDVDLSNLATVQDVINAINTAAGAASAGVTASFASVGNGIVLTDTAAGTGTLSVIPLNYSMAVVDLGLDAAVIGTTLTGRDVNPVEADGIFTHLAMLRDALRSNDSSTITRAAEGLDADYERVVRHRGQTGARVQELESRLDRMEDQNVATRALLSQLEDSDFTDAIARFSTLQTALQASLMASSRSMNLSLMDYL